MYNQRHKVMCFFVHLWPISPSPGIILESNLFKAKGMKNYIKSHLLKKYLK